MPAINFQPRLVPTLFAVPIVLLCLGLGVWQVQRLFWKEGLIAERAAATKAAPVPAPRTLADARKLEFRAVTLDGVFLNDREIYLHAIAPSGREGYQILTPLMVAEGEAVFIDRGFIPTELRDPEKREAGQLSGTQHVTGVVRLPPSGKPNLFLPANDAPRNHWFWVDLRAMAAADRLEKVAPYYLDADATQNPGGWPKGGTGLLPELPNHHLQYAITWFALAAAMVVIYVLYHRRPGA
ncbi:MAG TPA: SURF1 family protein [Stellaceae bacterium]|jgi:surfeit locus 1 family protein